MIWPPPFRNPEAFVFWPLYLAVFVPEARIALRALAAPRSPHDRGTLPMILAANQLALLAAFGLAFVPRFAMPASRWAFGVGLALLAVGGVLRRRCVRALGKYFTGAVAVVDDQPVIDSGPYRRVRHPSYGAAILLFTGVGVSLASWASAALLFVVSYAVYRHRAAVEERALLAVLGDRYRAYRERTGRFVPRLG